MAKLVVNSGLAAGREFELKLGVNSLGRGLNCDFRLEDASVSGAHAEIILEANSVTVKDLRSTNGTFINRSQIREGFLQPGQVISLGGVEMVFVADSMERSVSASASIARTVALPQIGGIKIARPSQPTAPTPAGFRAPMHYPAPVMPTPSLSTAPAAVAQTQIQTQTQTQTHTQSPAPVLTESVEARTWRHVEAVRPESSGALRCFGFGLMAAVFSGAVWTLLAAELGTNPTPYAATLTGLICGLAIRLASRNRPAAAYSLLAMGFTLLGIFIGASGQVFALQSINFRDYNQAGLVTGVVLAYLLGGVGTSRKAARRAEFA
jgi:hypothetical protein